MFGNSSGFGGGLSNYGTKTIINSAILNNTSVRAGGITNNVGATLDIENTTISQNSTTLSAGDASYTVGGVWTIGYTTITNCTITGNETSNFSGAGGINVFNSNNTAIANTIVLGNTGPSNANTNDNFTDGGGNITSGTVADVFAAIDQINGGGFVADNGGPVQTLSHFQRTSQATSTRWMAQN